MNDTEQHCCRQTTVEEPNGASMAEISWTMITWSDCNAILQCLCSYTIKSTSSERVHQALIFLPQLGK